jgi:hypothetical protein
MQKEILYFFSDYVRILCFSSTVLSLLATRNRNPKIVNGIPASMSSCKLVLCKKTRQRIFHARTEPDPSVSVRYVSTGEMISANWRGVVYLIGSVLPLD